MEGVLVAANTGKVRALARNKTLTCTKSVGNVSALGQGDLRVEALVNAYQYR